MGILKAGDWVNMADTWYGPQRKTLDEARVGLRGASEVLMGFSTMSRGITERHLTLNMMGSYPYPGTEACVLGDKAMPTLVWLTGHAKVNKGNEVLPLVAARHKDVLKCPISALSLLLYLQYTSFGTHEDPDNPKAEVPGHGFPQVQGEEWRGMKVCLGVFLCCIPGSRRVRMREPHFHCWEKLP